MAEPDALTDAQAAAPDGDVQEALFNDGVLLSGRDCRDTLARNCRWHVERDAILPVGYGCGRPRPRTQ